MTFSRVHTLSLPARALRLVTAFALLLTTAVVGVGLSVAMAPSAAAAAPLGCINRLFYTTGSEIRELNLTSGTNAAVAGYTALPGGGTNPNQLGIGRGGTLAMHGTSTSVVRYTPASDNITSVAKPTGVAAGTLGGINPATGLHYYGAYSGNTVTLYVYNPATNVAQTAPIATITVLDAPGANGDLAFDEAGRMYLVAGASTTPFTTALYVVNGQLPTSGAAQSFTVSEISRGSSAGSTNGMTFGSDGFLYLGSGSIIQRTNPITGQSTGTTLGTGGGSTDLASCATPSTLTVDSEFPDGPVNPGDDFVVGGSGGDYPGSFPGSGEDESTPPAIVLPGDTYTVVQTPANPGTDPDAYVTTYECTTVAGTVVTSGQGSTASVRVPTGTDGNSITCTFVNDLPGPSITLAKTVSPDTFDAAGQPLTYNFMVRNAGNTVLNGYTVVDTMPGLSGVVCTPAVGSTLQPDATASCTATYTTTAADVVAAAPKVNDATAGGTPPAAQGDPVSSSGSATAGFEALPPTAVDDAANTPFGASVTLPGSVNDTAGNSPIDPALTVFTSPAATDGGRRLETTQGVWEILPDGSAQFTPADDFSGSTEPVTYEITDGNGLSDTATLTVTVRPGPTADPDVVTADQGSTVTIPVLDNDDPGQNAGGSPGTLDPTSVVFDPVNQPAGAVISDGGKTVTVPGEGVYTISPTTGAVTFVPEQTFTGPAGLVGYLVTDSLGNTVGSSVEVTVEAVDPTANDDAANTPFATPVSLPAGNDDTAGPGGAIDSALTVFTSDEATDGGRILVTEDGTWQVQPDGSVLFTPADGFVGTTGEVEYQIIDANGQSDAANLRVTVQGGPAGVDDVAETTQNVDVSFPILGNDVPGLQADGSAGSFDKASLAFTVDGLPDGSTVSADGRTVTVPGDGSYVFDPANGQVTFDPEPQFTGDATPVTYTVRDQQGNLASAQIGVDVAPVTPVAIDDATKTTAGATVQVDVTANDSAGSDTAPLDPASVVFTDPEATEGGTVLVVVGEGRWEVLDGGVVQFTPEPGFTSPAGPVEYSIADSNGTRVTAEISVVVGQGPLAGPDAAVTPQNVSTTVAVLGNDIAGDQGSPCTPGTPGEPAGCDTGTLDAASVVFPNDGQPAGADITDEGKTLTVPDQGVYTIAVNGEITFDPTVSFTGTATAVTYQVTDSYGSEAVTTLTITVTAVTPTATDDTAQTPYGTPVELAGASNDTEGADSAPLEPVDTVFTEDGQPADAVVSEDGKTITVPDEGTYVLADDGFVTFTPADGFSGTTSPVTYRIVDANGTTGDATLTVTVRPPPSASPDTETTLQGVPVSVLPLVNDTPGRDSDDTVGDWVAAATVFPTDGQSGGAEVSDGGKTLTVPDEGTYTLAEDGTVLFTPVPTFSGVAAAVTYTATDGHGNTASSTITITVTGVDPVATDDTVITTYNTPVTFPGLLNDTAGADSAPLVPELTVFPTGGQPDGAVVSADGKTIRVPDEGTYAIGVDGSVLFTPAAGFGGAATSPVVYQITDENGTNDTAELVVVVRSSPVAVADKATTAQNVDVTVPVLVNDLPGLDLADLPGTWELDSLVFPTDGQPDGAEISDEGKTLTVPTEGVYTIGDDGQVTFDPEPTFRGQAVPVTYSVTDSLGNPVSATVTVTVTGIDPTAVDDAASTPSNTSVTLPGFTNDLPGATSAPLVPAATVFPTDGQPDGAEVSADGKTITVSDEGTYVINEDGSVLFTPVAGFDGETSPVTYQITDSNGTTDVAQLTVVVQRGPSASDDTGSTSQNVDVRVPVLGNDSPGLLADGELGSWDVGSVVFTTGGQPDGAEVSADGKTLTVKGEGVYTVDVEGRITFDPEPPFRGEAAPVTYSVTDSLSNDVTATLTITVIGINPAATDDAATTLYGKPVTLPGLLNDTAGADSARLVPASTVFPTGGQPDGTEVSDRGKTLTVSGEGVYTIGVDGSVLFTPAAGFSGPTSPVTYQIADSNGATDNATVMVTVRPGPQTAADRTTTPQGVAVTLDPLGNDTPGQNLDGSAGTFDPATVIFPGEGQPGGATVAEDGKTLTIPEVGTFTVDPVTGAIIFAPVPAYTGSTPPVTYTVADGNGDLARSTVVVDVTPVRPTATDDRASTQPVTSVTVDVLANDRAGADQVPLVPDTLRLVNGAGELIESLVVPREGTWAVVDGRIVFTPEEGFAGTTSPVTYSVADSNGTVVTAQVVVVVSSAGAARPDQTTTAAGQPVTIDVLDNDLASEGEELDPGSVCLVVPDEAGASVTAENGDCVKGVDVDGVGTWVVHPNGTITFAPDPGFDGKAVIYYTVTDTGGNVYTATLTITVTPQGTAPGGEEEPGRPGLPDTGGIVLGWLIAGLGLAVTGLTLTLRGRGRRA